MSTGINIAAIHGYATQRAAAAGANLDAVQNLKAQHHYNQDRAQNKADRANHQAAPVPPEIAAHSPEGVAATPGFLRPHLDGPGVANPTSPQSIAMRGYAAAAGKLATSF